MSPATPVSITINTRRGLVAFALVAVLAAPVAGWQLGSQVSDNCEKIHRLVVAGSRILDSPRNLSDALEAGTISRAQYDESLAQIHRFDPLRERNLRIWRSADCR